MPGGGDLVFCGHHANKYLAQLEKVAVNIVRTDEDAPGSTA
jgi:hypothetical protein